MKVANEAFITFETRYAVDVKNSHVAESHLCSFVSHWEILPEVGSLKCGPN